MHIIYILIHTAINFVNVEQQLFRWYTEILIRNLMEHCVAHHVIVKVLSLFDASR